MSEPYLSELSLNHENALRLVLIDYNRAGRSVAAEDFSSDFFSAAFFNNDLTTSDFQQFVTQCDRERLDWRPGPNKTSVSRYVMCAPDGNILALGRLQFPLDEQTEIDGGNLIVDVPPSLRRRGHGSYCLALMLFEAVRAGLRRVLVTCLADHVGARRMIEKNRGLFYDIVTSKHPRRAGAQIARYWIQF